MKNYIGLSDKFLNWLRSYLSNRRQKVHIESFFDGLFVEHGVPRGSILGPLFFAFMFYLFELFLSTEKIYSVISNVLGFC